jgi:bla regulator protein BlaR1
MITYLVNSTLCSGLLLAAYHLLLKNKAMYHFNRFYLLAGILFSLLVPLIVVRHNIALLPSIVPIQTKIVTQNHFVSATPIRSELPSAEPIDYRLYTCVLIYAVVTFLLIFRLIRNLYSIYLTLSRHKKISFRSAQLVLIKECLTPHTFLNNIFLNEEDYHHQLVEAGVLHHELAHARQWHSVDIILVELVQAFFWFNPFFFLYRSDIKVNHEFIADAAVLNTDEDLAAYQSLLFNKAAQLQSLPITSQFNYSITKKRLIMMTKTTSSTTAWLTRLALVPVIGAAFMLFCNKTEAQQDPANKRSIQVHNPAKPAMSDKKVLVGTMDWPNPRANEYPSTKEGISSALMKEYISYEKKYAARRLPPNKTITKPDQERLEQIYQQMSRAQQKDRAIIFAYPPPPAEGSHVSPAELASWNDPFVYGVWIDGKRIKNSELKEHNPDQFNMISFSRLTERAVKHDKFHYQIELMTLDYYKKYRENAIANKNNSMIIFHIKS